MSGKSSEKARNDPAHEQMFPVELQFPKAWQEFEQGEYEHQHPHDELDWGITAVRDPIA